MFTGSVLFSVHDDNVPAEETANVPATEPEQASVINIKPNPELCE